MSERLLKKINVLEIKNSKGTRFYRINFGKFQDLSGYKLSPYLIEKLNNNAKAALLLVYFLGFVKENKLDQISEIPSREIEIATGMSEGSQIYARDSLIHMNYLTQVSTDDQSYILNIHQLVNSHLVLLNNTE